MGKLVALCESKNCRLGDLLIDELQQACPQVEADVYNVLGSRNAVAALKSYGSGGREAVEQQVSRWKTRLEM